MEDSRLAVPIESDGKPSSQPSGAKPEDAPLYGAAGDNGDSLTPEQLISLISEYEEKATFEEREGCFGLAEIYWMRAFTITRKHLPADKSTARVAKSLGLFLHRFLPNSEHPIVYLRIAVEIETHLDSCSTDAVSANLDLARVLISIMHCEQAEPLLRSIIAEARDIPSTLRATTYLGQIRIIHNDWLKAEEILRANVEQARVLLPDSSVLAEALCALGKALIAMERFSEGRATFDESMSICKRNVDEVFFLTLRNLASMVKQTGGEREMKALFDSVLTELQGARPYIQANIVTIWGSMSNILVSIWCCLQALALYRSVRAKSWYAVRELRQLVSLLLFGKPELRNEAAEQLREQTDSLPAGCITVLLNPGFYSVNSMEGYRQKLESEIGTEDESVQGEILLILQANEHTFRSEMYYRISTFTHRFPNSTFTARLLNLYTPTTEEGRLRGLLKLCSKLRMPIHLTFDTLDKLATCYLHDDPEGNSRSEINEPINNQWEFLSMLKEARDACEHICGIDATPYAWLKLASIYERISEPLEAEHIFQRLVKCTATVNSQSRLHVESILHLGLFYLREKRRAEAQACMKRIADVGTAFHGDCVSIWPDVLLLYKETVQPEKLLQCFSECLRSLKAMLCAKQVVPSQHIAKNMLHVASSSKQLQQLIAVWGYEELRSPRDDSLLRAVQQFCAFRGRITVTFMSLSQQPRLIDAMLQQLASTYEKELKYGKMEAVQVKTLGTLDAWKSNEIVKTVRNSYKPW